MIVALIGGTKSTVNPCLLIRIANAVAGLIGYDVDGILLVH
ncbi:MAG: hypothetical protein ACJAVI_005414 [Candidatus Azotimanducaceae bacterium]|jgi:hypothetical protein